MAYQLMEHFLRTRLPEAETLADDRSHHGSSESSASPQDSYGSHPSITRYRSTADTSGRSRFRRFAIIYAHCDRRLQRKGLRQGLALGSGCCVGVTAWSGHLAGIAFSLLIFVLLGQVKSRTSALVLMVGYYAGATWQVIPGAATFFGHHANPFQVVFLWISTSLLLGSGWTTILSRRRATRLYTVPITIVLLSAPPIGLIGVASPLIAAGILFPGTAWLGLFITLVICGLLASYPSIGLAVAIIVSAPTQLLYRAPPAPSDWQAVSTHFGGVGLDTPSPLAEYKAAQSIQETALSSSTRVIVFPETVVSNWNNATDAFWASTVEYLKVEGKTILVGANVSDTRSRHYFNSIIIRGAEKQEDFLQRVPIPIAMWIPGSDRGVPLRLDGAGTLRVAGREVAVLICYEQLLIWPVVNSFREHPSLLIGIANAYWTRGTTVPEIQRACLSSWTRLFHVPMLWAENT